MNNKASDYQRLFQTLSVGFLISSIFMDYYKNLNVVVMFKDNIWLSYLPKSMLKKTNQDGADLYGDEHAYKNYKSEFENYMETSREYFNNVLNKDKLTKEDVDKFLSLVSRYFCYFSKTEFIYTDGAFLEIEKNKTTKENFKEFGEFKIISRKYLNELEFAGDSFVNRLVKKISSQFKMPFDTVMSYSTKELPDLFDGKLVEDSIIKARQKAYFSSTVSGSVESVYGDEAEEVINSFAPPAETEYYLKGITANKGKATGNVKIFRVDPSKFEETYKFIDSMKQGEILVAETTTPEIMVACKKAGAIITNQGGMMSHAAIVSRELNIPCVVGIGNATEVLKDGDLVEVDADKGIVRRLEIIEL